MHDWPDGTGVVDFDGVRIRGRGLRHPLPDGLRPEIGCGGGIGRTGTGMAVVAVRSGVPPEDAVEWVRARFNMRAVETPWQRRWVRTATAHFD